MIGKRILFAMGAAHWMVLGVGFANAKERTDTQRDGLVDIDVPLGKTELLE